MAGYLGTKAVLLSTTAADVIGNAEIGGDLTVGGNITSTGIDDNASSTAITIDSSGNLLVGTASTIASADFTVNSATNTRMNLASDGVERFGVFADNGIAALYAGGTNVMTLSTNATERMRIAAAGGIEIPNQNATNELTFTGGEFTNVLSAAAIGFQLGTTGAGYLSFLTNNAERMRIDSSGNLLVGTTSTLSFGAGTTSGVVMESVGTLVASRNGESPLYLQRAGSDGGIVIFYNDTSVVGSIGVSGTSTYYNTSSDYRLKTDAQPMTGASARVQALKPVNFEWIADGTRVDGFLAHEAQEVVPEAVTGTKDAMRDEEYEVTPAVYEDVVIPAVLDDDGNELEAERTEQRLVTEAVMGTRSVPDYQGIDQSKLVPLLTAALQEALTKIDDMETRLAALEAV